ncbi:MAG: SDR family oxidoreductase [Planctomycetia bacterium]|nr:SDR family oxidoreductase [Planctomycetia bacterium]
MADGFAAAGHQVIGCARSKRAVAEVEKALGPPHHFSAVDVSDDAAVARWAKAVLAEFGPPDLLVNNAAVINANAVLWEVPAQDFAEVMRVNVEGTVHVVRHFLPAMIKAGRGVIVNFSSGWGRSTSPEVAPYCASKYAIEGLTAALSQELPKPLAAVALNPGIIDTDMLRSCFGSSAGNFPSPQKWAKKAVPFLLSLDAKSNGKSLDVPT